MFRIVICGVLAALSLGGTLLALPAPLAETPYSRREAAFERWTSHAPQSYRIVIQVKRPTRFCFQELEVRDLQPLSLHDTCSPTWLSRMTVGRLFELSEYLDNPPECFPSRRDCVCHRVWLGQIAYDEQMGYPHSIIWQREMRPNWQSGHFWGHLLRTRSLPTCGPQAQTVRITVLSLTPLP